MTRDKTAAIILAGGSGERFADETPKQFVRLAGRTVIEHTIECLERNPHVDYIVVVTHANYRDLTETLLAEAGFQKVRGVVNGGASRQDSSRIGLDACPPDTHKVLLHDAVRPFLSNRIIDDMINALDTYQAVDVGIRCADTIIRVSDESVIDGIPPRATLRRGQTPQAFHIDLIREAYRLRSETGEPREVTDDCGLVFHHGLADIYVVDGEGRNIKITYPEDLFLADKLFQLRTVMLADTADAELSAQLRDKVVVVFGHSSGIGLEVCGLAREMGARVAGFSRRNGVDVAEPGQVRAALQSVLAEHGRIDTVICTAGLLSRAPLAETGDDEIDRQYRSNYLGAVNVLRAAFEPLKESQGSVVLFTSSSYTRGRALYALYSSMKAAVVNLAQAVADEWHSDRVRVNVVCPGRTDTPMRRRAFGDEPAGSLLDPRTVARTTLATALMQESGQVVEVRL
jgi:ribitol-5-phosphate 2-dehydrogenase (NADP+) / D-ribitol-5-phosphate cytidylyltransferase